MALTRRETLQVGGLAALSGAATSVTQFFRRIGALRGVDAVNESRAAAYRTEVAATSRGVREHLACAVDPESDSLRYLIDRKQWRTGELHDRRVAVHKVVMTNPGKVVFVDQQGSIVSMEERSSDIESSEDKQAWLDQRRLELAAVHPSIRLSFEAGAEEPRAYATGRSFLSDLTGDDLESSRVGETWRNSQEVVDSKTGETKLAYAYKTLKTTLTSQNLGERVTEELAFMMAYGLAGVESTYRSDAESSAGAAGVWQIMPDEAKRHGLFIGKRWVGKGRKRRQVEVDERHDFKKSTPVAALCMAELYKKFAQNPTIARIIEDYKVDPADIIIPAVINSYNTGEGNILFGDRRRLGMEPMLLWFVRRFTPAKVREFLGNQPMGKNLFAFINAAYVRAGHNADYGPDSREYYYRVAAMAELMKETEARGGVKERVLPGRYTAPQNPPEPKKPEFARISTVGTPSRVGESLLLTTGCAVVGLTAASRLATVEMSRRAFFRTAVAGVVGAGLLGHTVAHTAVAEKRPELELPPESTRPLPEEDPTAADILSKIKLTLPVPKASEIKKGRGRSEECMEALCGRQRLTRVSGIDTSASQPAGLVQLEAATHLYRYTGDARGKFVLPETADVISELSKELNRLAHEAGLPSTHSLRIVVAKATAGRSTHQCGNTADIDFKIDIVGPKGYQEVALSSEWHREEEYQNDFSAEDKLKTLLLRAVINLSRRGLVMFMESRADRNYHVMAVKPQPTRVRAN